VLANSDAGYKNHQDLPTDSPDEPKIYVAGFNSAKYSGSLSARPTDASTGAILSTEDWNAATRLDALNDSQLASRLTVSHNGTNSFNWSVPFASLPQAQKDRLKINNTGGTDSDDVGAARQAFIRGDRSQEQVNGGKFRNRDSRLGDIVNSNTWYTGRPSSGYTDSTYTQFRSTDSGMGKRAAMVYVGANDGMLHGFDATTGDEKIAYIPAGVANGDLRKLTYLDYVHQYFVDGSPFTGDVDFSKNGVSNWKTLLVGTLGLGGKGYFVLDVTDPSKFTADNAQNLALVDTTSSDDADLGNMISPPVMDDTIANKSRQIVKLNNNRWASVMGNGVNSSNEAPVLLIQYLDGDKSINKVSPCGIPVASNCTFKGSNGLSAPQLIDMNGDGKADVAYAGDIQGNLWKFNLGSNKDSEWTTAFKGQPYFVAKRGITPQSITTAPYWMAHPQGGVMVSFGTGQNLTDADPSDTGAQSYFAAWDNSSYTVSTDKGITLADAASTINSPTNPTLDKLQQQTISSTPTVLDGVNYYDSSRNTFTFGTGTGQKLGWYLDWPISKQRVLMNTRLFSGQKILVQSTIPRTGASTSVETCNPATTSERNFTSVLNMFYGTTPDNAPFVSLDANQKNLLVNASTVEVTGGDTVFIRTATKLKVASANCPVDKTCATQDFRTGSSVGVRAGWRQIFY
jgi:type IV pilus assembly protein PilY1